MFFTVVSCNSKLGQFPTGTVSALGLLYLVIRSGILEMNHAQCKMPVKQQLSS